MNFAALLNVIRQRGITLTLVERNFTCSHCHQPAAFFWGVDDDHPLCTRHAKPLHGQANLHMAHEMEPLLEVDLEPDEALWAELKAHKPELLALARNGPASNHGYQLTLPVAGDCVLCQDRGVHATVAGRWWCDKHWLGSDTETDEEEVQSAAPPTVSWAGDKGSDLDHGLKTKDIEAKSAKTKAVAL